MIFAEKQRMIKNRRDRREKPSLFPPKKSTSSLQQIDYDGDTCVIGSDEHLKAILDYSDHCVVDRDMELVLGKQITKALDPFTLAKSQFSTLCTMIKDKSKNVCVSN